MTSLVLGSPVARELKEALQTSISTFGLEDDPEAISDYILMMLANSKTQAEITSELESLFGEKFGPDFVVWLFQELVRLNATAEDGMEVDSTTNTTGAEAGSEVGDNDQAPDQFLDQAHPQVQAPVIIQPFEAHKDLGQTTFTRSIKGFIPRDGSGQFSFKNRASLAGNRVGKNSNSGPGRGPRPLSSGIIASLESDLGRPLSQNATAQFKSRCRHWPECSYPNCRFVHPTRACKLYPNCNRDIGTCLFIHVGEDILPEGFPNRENLMTEEQLRAQHDRQQQQQQQQQQQPRQDSVPAQFQAEPVEAPTLPLVICKFSDRCSNPSCIFLHPSPAGGESTAVTELKWCPAKLECTNPNCAMGHPSASLIKAPEPLPEKVLETCKFRERCTNPNCRYRHPRSPIKCRDGVACTRLDCLFTHPFTEACRFGANCKNPRCLFDHPPDREARMNAGLQGMSWVADRQTPGEVDQVMQDQPDHPAAEGAVASVS